MSMQSVNARNRTNLKPAPHPLALELTRLLGAHKVLSSSGERQMYSYDAIVMGVVPVCVVLPESTADVVLAVRAANAAGLPIVGRGAASGLSGGAAPTAAIARRLIRYLIMPFHRVLTAGPAW